MASAQDFPITEYFGCQPGYPLNTNICPPGQGFHNGRDYGCPSGTPIVVNGVTIGLSGKTGYVTGPHLHVGRWVNGKATDPGTGGFQFNSAVVAEINEDATNGKYVALNADGARWVYLHMSDNNLVQEGQKLEGGASMKPTEQDIRQIYQVVLVRDPTDQELQAQLNQGTAMDVVRSLGQDSIRRTDSFLQQIKDAAKPQAGQIRLAYQEALNREATDSEVTAQLDQPDLSHVLMSLKGDSIKAWATAAKGFVPVTEQLYRKG